MATNRRIQIGDRDLCRIGLGTNRLTDTPENHSFLEAALDAGIEMIDTAHLYTSGDSEVTIGNALAPFAENVYVATKGGYASGEGDNSPDVFAAELEQSLRSLQTDRIDLYYVHRVAKDVPLERTMELLAGYREDGKIAEIGLSEVSVEQIELARGVAPVAAVQNEYSLEERKHEEVIDLCEREGIAFVPFFPLRGDAKALAEIAAAHDASENQIKLAWLLARSPAVLPIPGTRSAEHAAENVAVLEIELDTGELDAIGG